MLGKCIPNIFKLSPFRNEAWIKKEVARFYRVNTSAGSLCAEGGPGAPETESGSTAPIKRWIPFNTPKRCP